MSSTLILEAEQQLLRRHEVGPDGFLTYVFDAKVASANPGYCFKQAGYRAVGRSADGRKTLLQKLVWGPLLPTIAHEPRNARCSREIWPVGAIG